MFGLDFSINNNDSCLTVSYNSCSSQYFFTDFISISISCRNIFTNSYTNLNENDRPLSKLSTVSRVLEISMTKRLMTFLLNNLSFGSFFDLAFPKMHHEVPYPLSTLGLTHLNKYWCHSDGPTKSMHLAIHFY